MNYDLHPQIILRVPRFPVGKASLCLEHLLQDPEFRDALYLGSDVIFEELRRIDFQLSKCSEKMRLSLAKYQKRICFRPTPFGGFAGIAVVPFEESSGSDIIVHANSFQTRVLKKAQAIPAGLYYCVNPFLYSYGADFRLIGKAEHDNKSSFAISEIFGSDLIRELIACRKILSRVDLLNLVRNTGVLGKADGYIDDLAELQIILPHYPEARIFPGPLLLKHKKDRGSTFDSYCSFKADGSVTDGTKQKLKQALVCLEKICTSQEPDALKQFKSKFEKLFDRREVPLLQALDPELGIDYDSLSNSSLSSAPGNKVPDSIRWSPLHELLLRKWVNKAGKGVSVVEILDEDLGGLAAPQNNYPPGISLMFTLCDDQLHVKAAGGVSCLNMIGRFTVLDPAVHKLAKDLARLEMDRNPNVVFAEISHIDSPEFASVKKKAVVYDFQIPFFEPPELPDDFVIPVNDLFISLAGDRIILRSARLNKQVVPRFSSAYNYHKSTLPVFRFLCDLQQEGLHANLNFSMYSLFPGMPAYPRVTYKDLILEAASWRLDAKELLSFKKLNPDNQFATFNALADNIALPQEFSYEVHDHLLPINRTSQQDISLLLKTIPSSGKIIFREYFKGQESLVKDEHGNSFTHEFIAFLTNRESSYQSLTPCIKQHQKSSEDKERLFPFDDWLYLKIYLHPAGYSELLVNHIRPFVAENRSKGNMSCWFFISYYDEDFHLRLRLKQMPGREGHLLRSYRKLELALRQLPNIRKIELSTYFKECERYSSIGIQNAEKLFELSSEIVLSKLAQPDIIPDPDKDKVFSGVRHLLMVCQTLGIGEAEIGALSASFNAQLSKSEKIELDLEFRVLKMDLREYLTRNKEASQTEKLYLEKLAAAIDHLNPNEKLQVLADLNHMHLNRLFLRDQRYFEGKSYYFLGKVWRGLTPHFSSSQSKISCSSTGSLTPA